MILLDTNIVSEFIKPVPDRGVEAWLNAGPLAAFFLCTPVIAGLRYGVALLPEGRRKKTLAESFNRLEREIFADRILGFDIAAAHKYGLFRASRQRGGRSFAVMDMVIAGIASANSMTLANRNTTDFDGLGLRLVNPFSE